MTGGNWMFRTFVYIWHRPPPSTDIDACMHLPAKPVTYQDIATSYGVSSPPASLGTNLPAVDSRIVQQPDPDIPEQISIVYQSATSVVIQWYVPE